VKDWAQQAKNLTRSQFLDRLKKIPIPVYLKVKLTAWENYYIPSAKKMYYIQEQMRLGITHAPEEAQGGPPQQAEYLQRTLAIPGLCVEALEDGRIKMTFERQALNQENSQ